MNGTMKEIGIWYFNTGWIIITIIGIPVGWLAAKPKKMWILWAWVLLAFIITGVMSYAKHS